MSQAWEEKIRRASTAPGVINLGGGLPSERHFPRAKLAESFLRVVNKARSGALQYGWAEGQAVLRSQIAARLVARGARVTPDDVLVTSGAQQAIAIATQLLLRPGQGVGVEEVTYPAALELFRLRRLVPTELTKTRCRYVMTLSNPLGTPLTAEARATAVQGRGVLIEDDAYGELLFNGGAVPLLLGEAPERTFHAGTFSKTLCPGLRVGWLVMPEAHRARARRLKEGDDLQANSLAQAVVSDYLAHADFEDHLQRLRRFYARRAARLASAVKRALPSWNFRFPEGGFCLWITADSRVGERRFVEDALDEGVTFDAGSSFSVSGSSALPTRLRLCFSYTSAGQFEEGARRLARAWHRVARASGRRRRSA